MDSIIICIGNKARGDDGAARRTADLLEGRLPEGVGLMSRPQLDVVMAEDLSHVLLVVFVDAERRTDPPVDVRLVAKDTISADTHGLTPGALLALAHALYGCAPRALLVSIAGPEMGHTEGMSETAEAASEKAASVVLDLLGGTHA